MNATNFPPRVKVCLPHWAKKVKYVFATFTEWSIEDPEEFAETAKNIWVSLKVAAAVTQHIVQTGDKVP